MYFSDQIDTLKVQFQIQKYFLMSACLCIVSVIAMPRCSEPAAKSFII